MIIRLSKERITIASPHIKKKPMVVNILNIFDKRIKSSNGDVERRPYVKTTLLMDGISKKIELTLTDRGPMDYTMLIGKKALGRRWLVNPAIRYLTSAKKEDKK